MGLFSSKSSSSAPADPPVRRDRVMRIMQAYMQETDAEGESPDAENASRRLMDVTKDATPAEYRAAIEAARRNGY